MANEQLDQSKIADALFPVRESRDALTAKNLVSSFRSHVSNDDDKRLASNLGGLADTFRIPRGDIEIVSEDEFIDLVKERKFPSPRNFEHLFESIGIPDINKRLSKRIGKTNFRLALESLLDVRNAIAHENPPAVTAVDVKRHIAEMRKWLSAIDREMYSHIVKTSGAKFWL